VLSPSPLRYPHPLPPSADLPLVYEAQLPLKEGFVRESLERIARLEAPLHPIHPSFRPLAYRAAPVRPPPLRGPSLPQTGKL